MENKVKALNTAEMIIIAGISCMLLCLLSGFSNEGKLTFQIITTIALSLAFVAGLGWFFKEKQGQSLFNTYLICIGASMFLAVYIIYLYFYTSPVDLSVFGVAILFVITVFLAYIKKLNAKNALILVLLGGFLIRLEYIFSTEIFAHAVRQHDVGVFGIGAGHSAYIEHFLKQLKLPDFDPRTIWQFYHPPLHHIIASLWIKFQMALGITYNCAVEGLQFLTLFYSITATLLGIRLCAMFGLRDKFMLIAAAIMSFSPAFILFAGSVNNDILSIVFALGTMYSAYKWYETDKLSLLFLTAVLIGLGMMTKLSAGLTAIPVAVLMLKYFIDTKEKKNCFLNFAIFGVIVFPLGLWWPVRSYLRFSVPFSYVPDLGLSYQYVGFRSFAERFVPFRGFGNLPCFSWSGDMEYNAWSGLFKSSAFGEYVVKDNFITNGLFACVVIIGVLAFIAMLYILLCEKVKGKWFMSGMYAVTLYSYLSFCYQYPQVCTMNIRYASPLIIIGAFFLGMALQRLEYRSANEKNAVYTNAYKAALYCVDTCAAGFILFVAAFYIPGF